MKTTFICNGKLQLICTPETELEKQLLTELFRLPVEATQVATMPVGDKTHANCVVITSAPQQQTIKPTEDKQ